MMEAAVEVELAGRVAGATKAVEAEAMLVAKVLRAPVAAARATAAKVVVVKVREAVAMAMVEEA